MVSSHGMRCPPPEPSPTGPIPCPYVVGTKFRLCITPNDGEPYEARVEVSECFTPFTMSPAMKVIVDSPPKEQPSTPIHRGNELVLKVYDRRFAHGLREYERAKPLAPTYESEAAYLRFKESGSAPVGLAAIEDALEALDEDTEEPPELLEHSLAAKVQGFFESECVAYRHLQSLQGQYIPRFYGTTRIVDDSNSFIPGLDVSVSGVLLEYVPGTNLDKIDPASANLDTLIRGALQIVDLYSDLGVINEDVRLENFIVRPDESAVVMIDWGLARLREEDEDDEEWRRAKWDEDEAGAIGYHAKWKFNWNYVPTHKYLAKAVDNPQ